MARTSLAKLVVSLEAETAKYRAELEKANSNLQKFTKDQSRALDSIKKGFNVLKGAAVGFVGALSAAKVVSVVQSSLRIADAIGKAADAAGVSTAAIQEYRFALGQLTNTTDQQVDQALQRFNRSLGQAFKGAGSAQNAIKELGVTLRDSTGSLRNTEQILDDVFKKLSDISNPAQRAALAAELFGDRVGPKLAAAAGQGAAAIEGLRDQLRREGGVIGDEQIASAEKLNDLMDRLKRTADAQMANAILENADAIEKLILAWGSLKAGSIGVIGAFVRELDNLKKSVSGSLSPVEELEIQLRLLGDRLASQQQRLDRFKDSDPVFAQELADDIAAIEQQILGTTEALNFFRSQIEKPAARGGVLDGVGDSMENAVRQSNALKLEDPWSRNMRDEQRRLDAMRAQEIEFQAVVDGLRKQEEVIRDSYDRRLQIIKDNTAEGSEYQQQLIERLKDQTNAQLEAIKVDVEEINVFAEQAARGMQQAFADFLFDPFQDGLKGMLDGFLKVIQRMVAEIASQKILAAAFGGLSGSGNSFLAGIGSAFGGGRASGGRVSSGTSYMVGERGPEIFTPAAAGSVSPMSGGVQIIDQRSNNAPPVDVREQMVNGRIVIQAIIRDELAGAFADGSIDKMFSASGMPVRRVGRR